MKKPSNIELYNDLFFSALAGKNVTEKDVKTARNKAKQKLDSIKQQEQKLVLEALKKNPNLKVSKNMKSQNKGFTDLPLFLKEDQYKLF